MVVRRQLCFPLCGKLPSFRYTKTLIATLLFGENIFLVFIYDPIRQKMIISQEAGASELYNKAVDLVSFQ